MEYRANNFLYEQDFLFGSIDKMYWTELLHTGVGMGIGAGAAQAVMAAERAIVMDSLMVNVCRKFVIRGSVAALGVYYSLRYMMQCDRYLSR